MPNWPDESTKIVYSLPELPELSESELLLEDARALRVGLRTKGITGVSWRASLLETVINRPCSASRGATTINNARQMKHR